MCDEEEKKQKNEHCEPKFNSATEWIESIAEHFINERFGPPCNDPSEFEAVQLERWTNGEMHRVIINPGLINTNPLSVDRLKSDLKYILSLAESNPTGFQELIEAFGDTELVAERAIELGLCEEKFKEVNGGFGWLLIIPVVLILAGCKPKPAAPSRFCGNPYPKISGVLCNRPKHNSGKHRNNAVNGGPYTW